MTTHEPNAPAQEESVDGATESPSERKQTRAALSVLFGILVPLFCLRIDGCVFVTAVWGDSPPGPPMVGEWTVFGYLAVFIGMLSLVGWLLLERCPALFSGLLMGGAAFAMWLIFGFLVPLTRLTAGGNDAGPAFFFCGIMALPPFLTAIVFSLNAIRAFAIARWKDRAVRSMLAFIMGVAISLGVPVLAQFHVWREVARTVEMVRKGRPLSEIPWCVARLRTVIPLVSYDALVADYEAESDPERRRQLDTSYQALTSWTIHDRVHGR